MVAQIATHILKTDIVSLLFFSRRRWVIRGGGRGWGGEEVVEGKGGGSSSYGYQNTQSIACNSTNRVKRPQKKSKISKP